MRWAKGLMRDQVMAWERRLSLLRYIASCSRIDAFFALVSALLSAAMSVLVVVSAGQLVGNIASGTRALIWLSVLSLSLSAQAVLGISVRWFSRNAADATRQHTFLQLATTASAPSGMAHMEDHHVVQRFHNTKDALYREDFETGLNVVWSNLASRLTLLGYVFTVASWNWLASIALAVSWLLFGGALSHWLASTFDLLLEHSGNEYKSSSYLHRLALSPAASKEFLLFGWLPWVLAQQHSSWKAAMDSVWRSRSSRMRPLLVTAVGALITSAVSLMFMAHQSLQGTVSVSTLATVVPAMLAIPSFVVLGDRGAEEIHSASTVRSVQEMAHLTHQDEQHSELSPVVTECAIDLQGVTFSYAGKPATLHDIDVKVPPGQALAIVGPNGSGKSTLVKLILGLYAPEQGRITVCHSDPRTLSPGTVSAVMQDFVRYAEPVAHNIALAETRPIEDPRVCSEVDAALSTADLTFLKSDDPAPLSAQFAGGRDLSGGQWQRIALARAAYTIRQGASVVMLDEPTSALDPSAEADVFTAFRQLAKNVTSVMVTHRLASVLHADRVIVLVDGKIVEDGDPKTLLTQDGEFSRMFTTQAEQYHKSESQL